MNSLAKGFHGVSVNISDGDKKKKPSKEGQKNHMSRMLQTVEDKISATGFDRGGKFSAKLP